LTHLPKRGFATLAELGADLLVAAHAEGADGALGQVLKLLLERVEHRRDRRIGMLRRRPFLVALLVAFATLRSGGIRGGVSSSITGMGACLPFTALAAAESMDISPLAAASAPSETFASVSVFLAAFVFWASLNLGCASSFLVCPASLDAATAFWPTNAV